MLHTVRIHTLWLFQQRIRAALYPRMLDMHLEHTENVNCVEHARISTKYESLGTLTNITHFVCNIIYG